MTEAEENRVRVYFVSERDLLRGHYAAARDLDVFELGVRPALPADAKILRVAHCMERQAFGFLVEHPSFDPVAPGCAAPCVDGFSDVEFVRAVKQASGDYRIERST